MTKVIWQLPIFVTLWALFLLIKIPTLIAGLFVIPFMYRLRLIDYVSLPWWTRPWSNPEDWSGQPNHFSHSLPRWWVTKNGTGFKSWYKYHAIRNGADGLRSFEFLDIDITQAKVKYWTPIYFDIYEPKTARGVGASTIGYIAWQGWRAGIKIVHIWGPGRHFVAKIGWRVEPSDSVNPHRNPVLTEDAGFATKFLVYRKG